MLHISRFSAAAVLLAVLSVSAMAIPSVLPEKTFQQLPVWAQNRVIPGFPLYDGTRLVLQVNIEAVRREQVERLRDDVRKTLREGRVGLVSAPVVRGNAVEVRLRDADLERGIASLREMAMPVYHQPANVTAAAVHAESSASVTSLTNRALPPSAPDIRVEANGNLIRLAVTEAAVRERVQQSRRPSMDIIARRIQEMGWPGASVRPRGMDLIEVEIPGLQDPSRLFSLMH